MSENPNALKHMYGPAFMKRMSDALKISYKEFDSKAFLKLTDELLELEMKPRVLLVKEELKRQLPKDYPEALKIILKAIKTNKLSGFDLWPMTEFIQSFGLEHSKISLDALKYITVLFTGEFAVRPFLAQSPDETLAYLLKCSVDKDHRVRRWASEGSRPRLPWGMKLHHFIKHPTMTIPILDKLWDDEELFVCEECNKRQPSSAESSLSDAVDNVLQGYTQAQIDQGKALIAEDSKGQCMSCHTAEADLLPAEYQFVPGKDSMNAAKAVLNGKSSEFLKTIEKRLITDKTMPPPPIGENLTQAEREAIRAYILSLAKK